MPMASHEHSHHVATVPSQAANTVLTRDSSAASFPASLRVSSVISFPSKNRSALRVRMGVGAATPNATRPLCATVGACFQTDQDAHTNEGELHCRPTAEFLVSAAGACRLPGHNDFREDFPRSQHGLPRTLEKMDQIHSALPCAAVDAYSRIESDQRNAPSADGTALTRLPPIVATLRIWREPMCCTAS